MRATIIKATRGAVATIHSGSDRRKKSKTIESTLDQVPGDFHSKYTARTRTIVTKMMFWALARPWKDHFKSDLRSDQDHLLKKDLRSD
jgi:hypothetical protein